MSDDQVYECEACGDLLEPGVDHDCPVTGTIHRLTEVEA